MAIQFHFTFSLSYLSHGIFFIRARYIELNVKYLMPCYVLDVYTAPTDILKAVRGCKNDFSFAELMNDCGFEVENVNFGGEKLKEIFTKFKSIFPPSIHFSQLWRKIIFRRIFLITREKRIFLYVTILDCNHILYFSLQSHTQMTNPRELFRLKVVISLRWWELELPQIFYIISMLSIANN